MLHILLFAALLGFWALLSGELDWGDTHNRYLMICGIVSCALVTLLVRRVGFIDKEGPALRMALKMIPYMFWLAWQTVVSAWQVAREVWRPKLAIDPSMTTAPYTLKHELSVAIYANSITLTPGTLTVSIDTDKRSMGIHQLKPGGEAGLKEMHDQVARLEPSGTTAPQEPRS